MTSKETDQIYITSVDKGLILADRSFPYHRWDPKTQTLVLDKKTPVSAKKMDQHLEELVEMMQDRGVGDALPRPESSRSQERSRSPLASPDQPPERQGLRLTLSSSS